MTHEPNAIESEVPVAGTDKAIAISRPDQGSRIVQLAFDSPGIGINVWEGPAGDDLEGFSERYAEWVAGDDPFLWYIEVRFGNVAYLTRAAIPHVVAMSLQYHRREDARAGVVAAAVDPATGIPLIFRRAA